MIRCTGGNIYVGGSYAAQGKGLLAGSGTVSAGGVLRTVRVYSTGTLAPGDTPGAIGTLTITGNLELQTASTLKLDIGCIKVQLRDCVRCVILAIS